MVPLLLHFFGVVHFCLSFHSFIGMNQSSFLIISKISSVSNYCLLVTVLFIHQPIHPWIPSCVRNLVISPIDSSFKDCFHWLFYSFFPLTLTSKQLPTTPAICFFILCALTLSWGYLLALGESHWPRIHLPRCSKSLILQIWTHTHCFLCSPKPTVP